MATTLADNNDMLVAGLDDMFRGRATWNVSRSETESVIVVGKRMFVESCVTLYEKHHRILGLIHPAPVLTCPGCRSPVDLPSKKQEYDYEYCEAQAVKWMERAARAER